MRFTVELPDETPDGIINKIAQAVSDAGGSVTPDDLPEDNEDVLAGEPVPMDMPPMPGAPLSAGPGAGMTPGAAMSAKGAFALAPENVLPPPPGPGKRRPIMKPKAGSY